LKQRSEGLIRVTVVGINRLGDGVGVAMVATVGGRGRDAMAMMIVMPAMWQENDDRAVRR